METKILSIIIPYYKETPREMGLPLASILIQAGVDFKTIECILVNDGFNQALPHDFLPLFDPPLSVRCVYLAENKGPGAARQAGIDNAGGEYVMFCDADDALENVLALKSLTESIRQSHPDVIVSPIIREEYDESTGQLRYAVREDMRQVLHGKVYRKAFLEANAIRFHHDLRTCEDTYFNGVVFACAGNIRQTAIRTYIKKYRPDSLTQADSADFHMENMPAYIKSIGCLCAAVETRRPASMQNTAVQYILYFFFLLHKRTWLRPEKKTRLQKTEQEFAAMMKPYRHYMEQAPKGVAAALYPQLRSEYFEGETETEALDDWLGRIFRSPQ